MGNVQNRDKFIIYSEKNIFLEGEIKDGCLHLESCVYGDEYDSEKHYVFDNTDTDKLFSLLSFEEFLESCRKGRLMWLEDYLEKNDIHPRTSCF